MAPDPPWLYRTYACITIPEGYGPTVKGHFQYVHGGVTTLLLDTVT